MTTSIVPRVGAAAPTDLLRIADLDAERLGTVLDLAARMKAEPNGWREPLLGQTLVCLFEKPSTRTRVSLAAAAHRLGMLPLLVTPSELQLGRGEPIADTARVLSAYASGIVLRTFAQERLEQLADAAGVPVFNALSDAHHPCQALADLLTIRERFQSLRHVKLAYVGDGNNVAHSLMEAGALAGMHVAVAAPPGYEPDAGITAAAQATAAVHGGTVTVTGDPREAVAGAHAVYTDVWVSMGEESERAGRLRALEAYRVDRALMALAWPDAIFLHCLPAHRGEEVTEEIIDGSASAVWQQAANRMPTEQAAVYALCTGWEAL